MTLRTGHGNGAGVPRVEVMPADELPAGVPAEGGPPPPAPRGPDGRFLPGYGAKEAGAAGGRAWGEQRRMARLLGRVELSDGHPMKPYRQDAAEWKDAHLAVLAATVGGGVVGPAAQAIVASAALQHATSRWLFDRSATEQDASLAIQASRLADASRQNLLAAHELCAKEALAREKAGRVDPNASLAAALAGSEPKP